MRPARGRPVTVQAIGDPFSAPVRAVPDLARLGRDVPAAARWNATLSTTETGEGFLEISWRKDGAA